MSSDVFILTSLWEGLPMSLLESMYMEKLCLVNDVIGNRDVIRSGVNGYVCRNADEFVTAIKEIMENPEKTAEMTAQARKDILENYNTRVMAGKYREIYEEAFAPAEKTSRKKKKKQKQ